MGNTQDNLNAAFAGESQANRRYMFFAENAEKEGRPGVARLFRAAAAAETVHARNHFQVIGGISTTEDNLRAAIIGEDYEFVTMYPAFIEKARAENEKRAGNSFVLANKVEEIHHGLFQEAMKVLQAGQDLKNEPYFICQVCGNTVAGQAPERCPVCGAPKSRFEKVD